MFNPQFPRYPWRGTARELDAYGREVLKWSNWCVLCRRLHLFLSIATTIVMFLIICQIVLALIH